MARTKKYLQFGIMQRIYQGSGCIQMIPNILETEGWKRVMVIADPGLNKAGLIKPFEELLKNAGVDYVVFDHVRPNPETITIDGEAIPLYHEFKADVMLAVGGGSTMDTAKGVAIVGDSGKKVMDFIGIPPQVPLKHKTYPIIAVPSTAGTGSDVCRNAVICDEQGYKLVPSHDCILPAYAVLDPDILASQPPKVAAPTAFDALTHALESYTNMNANDFTELFSLHSLELIGESIRPYVANPVVDEYANKMSLACMYAGFSLGIASIGQDHVLTHPMGEEPTHMTHGDACAMALPAVIEWNGLGCKEKYRKAYNALSKKNVSVGDFEVKMLIDWIIELIRDLQLFDLKDFEEFGYNSGDVKTEMLKHPILAKKDQIANADCAYPRVPRIRDFGYLLDRTNYWSKVIKGEIPYQLG